MYIYCARDHYNLHNQFVDELKESACKMKAGLVLTSSLMIIAILFHQKGAFASGKIFGLYWSIVCYWACNEKENSVSLYSNFFADLETILSYWDYGSCGPDGDDANWEWCRWTKGVCLEWVKTSKCSSGVAKLMDVTKNFEQNGCKFFYGARYSCSGIWYHLTIASYHLSWNKNGLL